MIPALKARLTDTNRNLAITALGIISTIAKSSGKLFEKHAKIISAPVISCLTDNKVHVRQAAISALDSMLNSSGLDSLIQSISTSLMNDNSLMRKDLTKWVSEINLDGMKKLDFSSLVHPILLCVQDRNVDIRKFSSLVLNSVVKFVGFQQVRSRAEDLFTGSQLQSLIPIIEAAKPAAGVVPVVQAAIPRPVTPTKKRASAMPVIEKEEEKVKRPVSVKSVESKPVISSSKDAPLLTDDLKAKELRAEKDRGMTKWVFEAPRKDLIDFLQEQCTGNFSNEICALLFSTDHYKEKDFLNALTAITEPLIHPTTCLENYGIEIEDLKRRYIANSDLILKYLTLRFFDTNTSMFLKSLELLEALLLLLDAAGAHLGEYEASSFLPFFITKVILFNLDW